MYLFDYCGCFVYFVELKKTTKAVYMERTMEASNINFVSQEEAELAKAARKVLMSCLDRSAAAKILLSDGANDAQPLELPPKVLRVISDVLRLMSKGESFSLVNSNQMFSTQEAANFLSVSRPYVSKLVDSGQLKASMVGRHRRIEFSELKRFQVTMREKSNAAMRAFSEEFGGED